jgi:hypothetical protein
MALGDGNIGLAMAVAVLQFGATACFSDDCDNANSQTDLGLCYGQQNSAADAE